jgi:hypothetical protein
MGWDADEVQAAFHALDGAGLVDLIEGQGVYRLTKAARWGWG